MYTKNNNLTVGSKFKESHYRNEIYINVLSLKTKTKEEYIYLFPIALFRRVSKVWRRKINQLKSLRLCY